MTTVSEQAARVLLVGRRPRVLDELGRALRSVGMHVREETDVDRVRSGIDGSTVDVLALGRAVPGSTRDGLVAALRARNPLVKVVDGLVPITAILVAQVQEVLGTPAKDVRIVGGAAYEPADSRFVLVMRRPAQVAVTLHRLDPIYRAHEEPIFTGRLDSGRQHLPVLRRIGRGERFLVVHADTETTVHKIG